MSRLSHLDDQGRPRMVDVGDKTPTDRRAVARGELRLGQESYRALSENRLAKGDALGVARLAGLAAAKRTAEWIPLCHTVPLDHLDVEIELDDRRTCAVVSVSASAHWKTGVEMEALVGVAAACLALYDMVKALDRGATIGSIRLLEKSGGRSGAWKRGPETPG